MSAPVVKFENLDDEGDCVKGWFLDHPRLFAVTEVSCVVVGGLLATLNTDLSVPPLHTPAGPSISQ